MIIQTLTQAVQRVLKAHPDSLTEREIRWILRDFAQRSLTHFYEVLTQINWDILPVPPKEKLQQYASLIHPDDLHALAGAVEDGSEFLLTLDHRHILAAAEVVEKANLPIRITTPGHFIQQYYPLHEAFPSVPEGVGRSWVRMVHLAPH